jgi:hypothetical protein
MKKLLIGPAVVLALLAFSTSSLPYQNEPTGFHGMAWGTPLSAVQTELRQSGVTKYGLQFVKPYDDMHFGIVPLAAIFYYFRNGVLETVGMRSLGGPGASSVIVESLELTFGPPTIQATPNLMFWKGDSSIIVLSCDTASDGFCNIVISSSSTAPKDTAPIPNVEASPQSSTAQNNTNQEPSIQQDQRRSDATQAYKQCMNHCTTMVIICNTGSEESIYTASADRCDTKFHNCEADCAAILKRQW